LEQELIDQISDSAEQAALDQFAAFFDYDNVEWYRDLLVHLRYKLDRRNYPMIANFVAEFLNNRLTFPTIAPEADDGAFESDMRSLRENGFCRLGKVLDDAALGPVHTALESAELSDSWNRTPGRFTRANVPGVINVAEFDRTAIHAAPALTQVANDPRTLARVAAYLGAPPTIQHYIMWWSFAGDRQARDAQLFHEDRACYRFLKLFVYLTDVGPQTGPHVYIRGSASMALRERLIAGLEQRKKGLGELARNMLAKQRVSDRDIETFFGTGRTETFVGKAGEAFLVDTSGYHKGQLPTTGDRLLFQTLYTMLPTVRDVVAPVDSPGFFRQIGAAHPDIGEPALRYINRLVVRDPISRPDNQDAARTT
jgi:hypothetical protein